MVKIVKNPGNGRLNNLNDPVLNVLTYTYNITTRDSIKYFVKIIERKITNAFAHIAYRS